MKYSVDRIIEKRKVEKELKVMTEKYEIFKNLTIHRKWTGIRYYGKPRHTNKLLVIGIFGKLFYCKFS